jgi:pimeloyl-ACP methyl ester carboxylesterase
MARPAKPAILVSLAIFPLFVVGSNARAQAPTRACASLTSLQLPETTISNSEPVAAKPKPATPPAGPAYAMNLVDVALPPYCLASGEIDRHTGPDGKSYGIGFALALPDKWNGRFLFQGGGGLDGVVRPPLGTQAAGDEPALARGFSVVSMDSGHESKGFFDVSFNVDQESSLDFAYIALGKVTTVAKEIIAKYYGESAKHSYFVGCSTGGRQAMLASQRYPLQFDGIVSGDPAMRTGYTQIASAWNAAAFNRAAPKDAQGQPIPGETFSDSDRKLLTDSILNECDAKDGLKDGMIFDFQGCHYNPDVLTCKGAKTDACLSPAQVTALQKVFAGPRDSQGIDPYVGRPYDSGIAIFMPGTFGTVLPQSRPGIFGRPNLSMSVDVDALERRAASDPVETLTDTTWTNLSTFKGHGGKVIFYHGLSDPAFSPYDTLRYYNEMAKANGGAEQVRNWSRIFLVPGMNHCAGGPSLDRFDALGAVVKWVEQGTAPDSIVATGKYFPGRSRPLCAYPKHAQYKGSGDPQDAANFVCAE